MLQHDLFISYASEDKAIAESLVVELFRAGVTDFWWDRTQIKLSDLIPSKIDEGLTSTRYLVAIVSKNYFTKHWTRQEFDAIRMLERPVIPVWVNVGAEAVRSFSPALAARKAVHFYDDPEHVASEIVDLLSGDQQSSFARSAARRKELTAYWGMVWFYVQLVLGVLDPATKREMDAVDRKHPWDKHVQSESGYTPSLIKKIRARLSGLTEEEASLAVVALLKRSSDAWFPTYCNELEALTKAGIQTW